MDDDFTPKQRSAFVQGRSSSDAALGFKQSPYVEKPERAIRTIENP